MRNKTILSFILLLYYTTCVSQVASDPKLSFDFNDHRFKEANNKVIIKPVGVTFTEDRFGNKESAVYVHGTANSYINLGTSDMLKPKNGSISLWVNIQSLVLAGKGYNGNPFCLQEIIQMKTLMLPTVLATVWEPDALEFRLPAILCMKPWSFPKTPSR